MGVSRGRHVIIARYDKDLARGDACFIPPSPSTRRLCPLRRANMMIWRCAVHKVGLEERLGRMLDRKSGRPRLPAHCTPSDRIEPLRPVSASGRAASQQ